MNIAICPECKKAGLRVKSPDGETTWDRFEKSKQSLSAFYERWCPRCKEWVHPIYKKAMVKK